MQDRVQLISELDADSVWRVDTVLLTMEEVKTSSLREDACCNIWYPVIIGAGWYCYFVDKQKASDAITAEVVARMQELEYHLDSLN